MGKEYSRKCVVRILDRGYIDYCEWWGDTKETEYGVVDDITFARIYTSTNANLLVRKLKKKGIAAIKIVVE